MLTKRCALRHSRALDDRGERLHRNLALLIRRHNPHLDSRGVCRDQRWHLGSYSVAAGIHDNSQLFETRKRLFAHGGIAILDRIVAHDYDVLAARPKLGRSDFARLVWKELWE